jgi:putative tricarboxylic transport membrane protein
MWSLAIASVLGTALCLLLAKPIARLTLVPFAMLAPFMIAIIYFAAYQTTRVWYDLITLFALGVLGVYMKRFGWSPPALLIGFVLSSRLDAAVYQSVQVYGMSFLERPGVQVMLALIAISIVVAVRMRPHRPPLAADGPHAPVRRAPQLIFLGLITACVAYAVYEVSRQTFLARVFPLAVALITLALLVAVSAVALRDRPSHVLYDAEREETAGPRPAHSRLHYMGWMLGLLAAAGVLGFVLGVFAFISVFLRVKAGVRWSRAVLGASGAVVLLSAMSRFLVLDYPEGILQHLVAMPWPFN